MFVVTISSIDRSCHTQECDAIAQKLIFISVGELEENITIVEKDTYNPPQE